MHNQRYWEQPRQVPLHLCCARANSPVQTELPLLPSSVWSHDHSPLFGLFPWILWIWGYETSAELGLCGQRPWVQGGAGSASRCTHMKWLYVPHFFIKPAWMCLLMRNRAAPEWKRVRGRLLFLLHPTSLLPRDMGFVQDQDLGWRPELLSHFALPLASSSCFAIARKWRFLHAKQQTQPWRLPWQLWAETGSALQPVEGTSHGGHPQAHKGRCVPALIIGPTALVLCFLGGNQRVSNLVTILKLVWLKWLVGTHTTAMATDTWHIFFLEHEMRATFLVHK